MYLTLPLVNTVHPTWRLVSQFDISFAVMHVVYIYMAWQVPCMCIRIVRCRVTTPGIANEMGFIWCCKYVIFVGMAFGGWHSYFALTC